MWSICLGQDANWDLRNYHWYNAYQLLDWRFRQDIAPGGIQTYLSPLFDVPWYLLAQWLPGPAVGFIIGAVQSANFVLLYLLARRLLDGAILPFVIAVIGVAAPSSRNLIGTTFNDLIVSALVLGALYLVSIGPSRARPLRAMFGSGLLLGFAAAGKLTAAPFAIGALASLAVLGVSWERKTRFTLAMCAGGLLAGLLFMAPWFWWLYHLYGSPTFPFLNGIFHSPWTTLPDLFNPSQRPPHDLLAWLVFPYEFVEYPRLVSAVGAVDYRLLAGYLVIPAALGVRWLLRAPPVSSLTRYLLAFAAISYVLWAATLDVDRYAVPIAMLVPLLITALTVDLSPRMKPVLAAALVPLIFLGGGSYERVPWSRDFISADIPAIADPAHTLVVLLNQPLGYLATLLPEATTVVFPTDEIAPLSNPKLLWTKRLLTVIDKPWATIVGFADISDIHIFDHMLGEVGLQADPASCRPLVTTFSTIAPHTMICHLTRKAAQ